MSSEEKISPDEFDQELEALMSGKKEPKKKKGGKKKKIAVSAAVILVLGIAAGKILGGGKDMVPVVDTVNPVRKTIQNRLSVTGPVSGTDSVDVVSNLHAEILEIPVKEGDKVTKGQTLAVLDDSDVRKNGRYRKKRLRSRSEHLRGERQRSTKRLRESHTGPKYRTGELRPDKSTL